MAVERAGLVRIQVKSVKALGFLDLGSTFVNVCGYNAICSSEGQGDSRLKRHGSLLPSFGVWGKIHTYGYHGLYSSSSERAKRQCSLPMKVQWSSTVAVT
ncbi:hypothetical protein TNCV_4034511 [Trichonephila clavipes]|nr:hypothetical protein TNCV_4034511 [Trichonephila clavipes]